MPTRKRASCELGGGTRAGRGSDEPQTELPRLAGSSSRNPRSVHRSETRLMSSTHQTMSPALPSGPQDHELLSHRCAAPQAGRAHAASASPPRASRRRAGLRRRRPRGSCRDDESTKSSSSRCSASVASSSAPRPRPCPRAPGRRRTVVADSLVKTLIFSIGSDRRTRLSAGAAEQGPPHLLRRKPVHAPRARAGRTRRRRSGTRCSRPVRRGG